MLTPQMLVLIAGGLGFLLLVAWLIVGRSSPSVVDERLESYSTTTSMTPELKADTGSQVSQQIADSLNDMLEGTDIFDNISRNLARADLKLRPGEFLILIVASSLVSAALALALSGSIGFAVLAGVFGIFLPQIYVTRQQKKRLKEFDNQLGDMLNLMVNGLRAGYSTMQAMEAVSRELPAPISTEFKRVVQEMQLGIPMEDALDHLLRRISSEDLDMLITAINVQREVGGNLAEILDVISFTIRERVRIRGEIMALTAQGRATAWVIAALPIVLMLLLYLVNRPYFMQFFAPETRTCGIPMLIIAGVMVISGFAITQKIVAIDI